MKRHASHPNNNSNTNTPPLPTMPTTPNAAAITTASNANDAYKKMPDTPSHGNIDHPSYEQNKPEHRGGFWHALMSLMTCGTH